MEADFSGYATKAGLKCTDGRVITPEAFKHMDKKTVPLVWQHGHNSPENILGHGILEARPDGMYVYGFFNDTPAGQNAKQLVMHKDITALSIYANQLMEKVVSGTKSVLHGMIREVSLAVAGANPGAFIDNVRIAHSADDIEILEDEAIITTGLPLEHADGDKTFQQVFDSMTEEQQQVTMYMIAEALKSKDVEHSDISDDEQKTKDGQTSEDDAIEHKDKEKDAVVHQNVFERNEGSEAAKEGVVLSHSQVQTIFDTAKKGGTLKEAILAHAGEYGITNIEVLFPDAQAIDNKPEWITRRMEWVETIINGTRKLPFSRIKSLSADLTHEEARAKGYIKGTMKKEQFFAVAKRETTPKTIYKKQKLDRDDIIDITDFDVVAWIWAEMRFMFREEVARAILIGDGREVDDPDKIDETKIRPIAMDDEFYTDVVPLDTNISSEGMVEAVLRARENYHGAGSPTAFMLQSVGTDLLLTRDKMGRRLYRTLADLASEMQVREIVYVPVMTGVERDGGQVLMILVNLSDYSVGSTKGGELTPFDDFDIDFNQYKYLLESRMSGALTKHKTAQVFVRGAGTEVTPQIPTFNSATGVVTIPNQTGVVYQDKDTEAVLTAGAQAALEPGESIEVDAVPASGYYFPHNLDSDWLYTRDA